MRDHFDTVLLHLVQRDSEQTAEELAEQVALSPSAIARRLRRLRADGVIARSIALLGDALTRERLRALVLVQLGEHADRAGKTAVLDRLDAADCVQFVYELSGDKDFAVLFDCRSMDEFVRRAEELLGEEPAVHRYESSIVKRTWKFAPFVRLS